MHKGKVSVVLATYNEEKNIHRCLNAIKGWVEEIVIVDGTSTDNTVEIAKKYGAKVTITDNPPMFHINKQKAIDMATCEWILQMDADEVVSKELKEEISQDVIEKQTEHNGFWIPRKNYFLGRFLMKGGQYPDYTLRLYRNGKGKLPQKDVHEQAEVEGSVGYLKHPLLHYPYKDFSNYLSKWMRYNRLLADQIHAEERKKNSIIRLVDAIKYLIVKPIYWFLLTYIRHKGFVDLWPGFVFSFFSALRFPVSYIMSLSL
jgi:glycosyltransferase involved in cell wall biosynthesis